MRKIVWDRPEEVMKFVADKVGENNFERYSAIGLEKDGNLIAGVIFKNKNASSIMMHVASDGSRHWMTPAYMAACFGYAFNQEKVNLIIGLVRADNYEAQRFDEHLGFKRLGQLPQACSDGTDIIIYGMLKSECRYLGGKHYARLLRELGISESPDSGV